MSQTRKEERSNLKIKKANAFSSPKGDVNIYEK